MICDLAETYHIYDYRRVPGRLLGTLTAGLRDNSRVMQEIGEQKADNMIMMLARISDQLTMLGWDGKGKKPKMLTDTLIVKAEDPLVFNSGADFDEYRKKLLEKINNEH